MENTIWPEFKWMPTHHTCKVCGAAVLQGVLNAAVTEDLMISTISGARNATKSLCKILSDLIVYNYQWIIHAGYVEDLCVILAVRAEECLKIICRARTTRKDIQINHLLCRCVCQKGVQIYRKLIHPLQVIIFQMIEMIHLNQAWNRGGCKW